MLNIKTVISDALFWNAEESTALQLGVGFYSFRKSRIKSGA